MIELDISKIPGLKRVEYYDDVIHMWEGDSKHPHGVYVSSVEWCDKMIVHLKEVIEVNIPIKAAGAWPSSSQAGWAIEAAEKDLLYWTYIYQPCAIDFLQRLKNDQETEFYPEDERLKFCGKMMGTKLKGPNNTISSMRLKPGERFICNQHFIKYVYQNFIGSKNDYGFSYDEHEAINEATGKYVKLTDNDHFQKLTGKGKVIPDKEVKVKIADACNLAYWEYADYIAVTCARYMRINKVLHLQPEDIKKVIELIKSVS